MRQALALTMVTLLAGACGESHLNNGVVIPAVEHIASQCPTQKDIPAYTITSAKSAPGIQVVTNDVGLSEIEVDGHQKTRTFDKGKSYYIYRAGCKDSGYSVNYQYAGRPGSIKVQKTNGVYVSKRQYGDEPVFEKQVTK